MRIPTILGCASHNHIGPDQVDRFEGGNNFTQTILNIGTLDVHDLSCRIEVANPVFFDWVLPR
jgi:hypothetical protein